MAQRSTQRSTPHNAALYMRPHVRRCVTYMHVYWTRSISQPDGSIFQIAPDSPWQTLPVTLCFNDDMDANNIGICVSASVTICYIMIHSYRALRVLGFTWLPGC